MLTQIYDVGAGGVTPIGIGSGLLAGISYAIFIFGFKNAARYGSPPAILMVAFAVLVIILLWPSDATQMVDALTTPDWAWFIALGVIGAGVSFILYIIGLKYTVPTVASIMAMIEPVTASLFGVVILNEGLAGLQILGMGLILITVTALSVYQKYAEDPAGVTPS
jgi:drug/metabolite transporter (DMT)-like permease